jgi:hypothetical protein
VSRDFDSVPLRDGWMVGFFSLGESDWLGLVEGRVVFVGEGGISFTGEGGRGE